MPLHRLLEEYKESYGHECPLSFITNHMEEIIEASLINCIYLFNVEND